MTINSSPNIFLSSTYLDLIEERNAACRIIINGYSIIRMEDWSAEDRTSKEKILKEIKKAAAVVLILGFKYGTIDEEEGISLTEFEFDTAKKLNIPVYCFIKKENGQWKNNETNPIKHEKLKNFKSKIDKYLRASFESLNELKTLLLNSLNDNHDEIWYNKTFRDSFFTNNVKKSIADLDNRYNNELNVELDITSLVDSMSLNESFKNKFKKEFLNCFCSLKKLKVENIISKEEFSEILLNLESEYLNILNNNFNNFNSLIILINEIITKLHNLKNNFDNEYHENKLSSIITNFENFLDNLNKIEYKLCSNPYLLLKGRAGVGKSHFLADISLKRIQNSEMTLLFLGSYFNNDDIGLQIVHHLNSTLAYEEFLYELNQKAKIQKSRIIIIIDALNECPYKNLWSERLNGFVSELKKYEWLGLIVSIRNTYEKLMPENNDFLEYEHDGFGYNLMNALKKFSCVHNVNYPSCPILNHEFSNPLILKILFDNISKNHTEIPQNGIIFSEIIEDYVLLIDKSLHSRFNLPEGINVVTEFIERYISQKLHNGNVNYRDALKFDFEIIGHNNYILIDALIKEDLFVNINGNVYFSYEKIGDYLIAQYLLKNISVEELLKLFKEENLIYNFINNNVFSYLGILESLAIILPEKYNMEIYEINFDCFDDLDTINNLIPYWFIESLYWRNPSSVCENAFDYIKNEIIPFEDRFGKFIDAMILLSYNPNFILNAEKLHEFLSEKSLNEIDSIWTTKIHYKYNENNSIHRFVNWIFTLENNNEISKESLRLMAITLSWFLTSTNNKLRNDSTYALIYLLKNDLSSMKYLLEYFSEVNDPYIQERLLAVAYGVILRSDDFNNIKLISEHIYNKIFCKHDVFPHILVRDYARSIIEYANFLNLGLNIDTEKLWYCQQTEAIKEISENEIKKIISDKTQEGHFDGVKLIVGSMHLDFGNYVFKSKFDYWGDKININKLRNFALKEILELYDNESFGEFDNIENYSHSNRKHWKTERIGKKYQWLIFYKLLALISEQYKLKNSWTDDNEHYMKGAWELDVRNFDPTINFRNNILINDSIIDKFNLDSENENWAETVDDLININELLIQNILDEKWLLLFSQINWNNSDNINFNCYYDKSFYINCQCLIVKKGYKNIILNKLKYEKNSDIYLDHNRIYQVFDREYSWSKSFTDLTQEKDFQKILYRNSNEFDEAHVPFDENIYEIKQTTEYVSINNFKPSKLLFDNLKLKYGEKDNILYSDENEPTVIDLSNDDDFIYQILINKNKFISFLDDNNFDIIWLISGSKLSYVNGSRDFKKDLHLNGVYTLSNGNISGKLNFNHHQYNYLVKHGTNNIHLNSCELVKNISDENCDGFDSVKDALDKGYHLCSECLSNFMIK